jgi:hypothetical protein
VGGCEERSCPDFQNERHQLSAATGVTPVTLGSHTAMPRAFSMSNRGLPVDVTASGHVVAPVAAC